MKIFQVAPFDQNLTLDGRLLEGNEKTLAQLQIFPLSVIELRVRISSGSYNFPSRS